MIGSIRLSVRLWTFLCDTISQKPLFWLASNYHSMCILWVSSPEKIMVTLCWFSDFVNFVNFSILTLNISMQRHISQAILLRSASN